MTAPQRLEQDLPQLLAQLVEGARPDYRDSLVEAVGRTRQRPAWTLPGRWLPMDITAQRVRPASGLRVPIALLIVVALVAAGLVAIAVASRPAVPAPFGPARNGMIVYGSNGDLYALSSPTAQPRLLVGGPDNDHDPAFAPEGDQLLFLRDTPDGTMLQVMRPDGSGLRQLVTPIADLLAATWSPDGTRIAFAHRSGDLPKAAVVDVASGMVRPLDTPGAADTPLLWRPNHEGQLAFRATTDDGHHELHLIDVETGKIVPIAVPPETSAPLQFDAQRASWSPDGQRLVIEVGSGLSLLGPIPVLFNKLVDVADDGTVTGVTPFIHDRDADYEYMGTFTPDGRSLLFASQRGCEFQSWIAPLDNPARADPVAGRTPAGDCATSGITPYVSPDGSVVLSAKGDGVTEDRLIIGRRDGGEATSTPITTDGAIAWQRLAP